MKSIVISTRKKADFEQQANNFYALGYGIKGRSFQVCSDPAGNITFSLMIDYDDKEAAD